ncbi:uncharacterized protein VP01_1727g2 [Puccinia sorghi]|uniref:Serine/threonine-protein phosphatase 4 regulatory subunit 3-like central domain-containing protein n=1 Tax=Puccinia sorghi TaxID=27349 RepID=A0A0L6VFE1_9BASI|nr:uncharacterized protein VP01_1727g2 [Puccinia sorghi]
MSESVSIQQRQQKQHKQHKQKHKLKHKHKHKQKTPATTTTTTTTTTTQPEHAINHPVQNSNPKTESRRVKVYELQAQTWIDRGTGHCIGIYEPSPPQATTKDKKDHHQSYSNPPIARLETIKKRSKTSHRRRKSYRASLNPPRWPEGGGIYQKQQATLVVWTEPDGTDMALSFATPQGCQEIWSFLCDVQNWLVKFTYPPATTNTTPNRNRSHNDHLSSHRRKDAIDWDDDELHLTSTQPISNHHTRHLQLQPQPQHHSQQPDNKQQPQQSTANGDLEGHPTFLISRDVLGQQSADDLAKSRIITSENASPPSTYNHLLKPNLQHISVHQFTQLPEPSLANLAEIENLIKSSSCTSIGRERISTLILKMDYIRKLEPVRIEAEDLESLKDLHTLCMLLQSILMLNDAAIYEYCLQDDIVLIAASILDCESFPLEMVHGILCWLTLINYISAGCYTDDPEFGCQKASYHADLSDQTRFKEVVPIRDEQIKSKIHLTYRLQYFKDIILARIMDDSTFSIINSMLFFNQVEIVQYLHSSDHFMRELFGIFDMETDPQAGSSSSPIVGPPLPPSMISERADAKLDDPALLDRKIDTILFLQQLCAMAKHLQAPSRISFFRSLAERGILKVVEFGLSKQNLTHPVGSDSSAEEQETKTKELQEEEAMIKSVVCEILMTIIDYDPISVRGYCLKQRQEETKTLAESLIELLISEADLGLKVQLTDALRTLLDMGGTGLGNASNNMASAENCLFKREEDPDNERFLQFFYDHCVHVLAGPFLKLPELTPHVPPDNQETVSISPLEAATFNHLCEMICFIIIQHSFRSKYFILSTNLLNKVGSLLTIISLRRSSSAPPTANKVTNGPSEEEEIEKKQKKNEPKKKNSYKYLELVGLKILKTCFNKKDQFYDRALIKNSLIDHVVLDIFISQDGKDNLVSSACLELFENIRLNNPKAILNHLMDKRAEQIGVLAQKFNTFQSLIQRWEQNNDPNGPSTGPPQSSSSHNTEENSGEVFFHFAWGKRAHNVRNIGSWSKSRTLDAEEENYFNDSDDEEEEGDVMIASSSRMGGMGTTRKSATQGSSHKRQRSMTGVNKEVVADLLQGGERQAAPVSVNSLLTRTVEGGVKPLVDYADEDEEGVEPAAATSPPRTTSEEAVGLSGEPPPKVKLGERRRREEDEEDEAGLGGLLVGAGREAKRGKRSVPMARTGATKLTLKKEPATAIACGSDAAAAAEKKNQGLLPVQSTPKSLGFGSNKIVLSLSSSSLIAAAGSSLPPVNPISSSQNDAAITRSSPHHLGPNPPHLARQTEPLASCSSSSSTPPPPSQADSPPAPSALTSTTPPPPRDSSQSLLSSSSSSESSTSPQLAPNLSSLPPS